jgi:hypothetical protein
MGFRMLIQKIAGSMIRRAEKRVGVSFDYVHKIAQTDLGLLLRYNRLFGFLDPSRKTPAVAHHVARLRGAIAADCGTCVEAEIGNARNAGVEPLLIDTVLSGNYAALPPDLAAVATLSDAVTSRREDDPEAREIVREAYGEAGLIELSFAMNGAALLPGIKRAMGYATACNIDILRKQARRGP